MRDLSEHLLIESVHNALLYLRFRAEAKGEAHVRTRPAGRLLATWCILRADPDAEHPEEVSRLDLRLTTAPRRSRMPAGMLEMEIPVEASPTPGDRQAVEIALGHMGERVHWAEVLDDGRTLRLHLRAGAAGRALLDAPPLAGAGAA